MKKSILILIAASLALAVSAFALDVLVDVGGAGTGAPGPAAMNRAVVFSGSYDLADGDIDGTNLVSVLNTSAGVVPTHAVLDVTGLSDTAAFTLYRKVGTGSWAAVGAAKTVTVDAETPLLYHLTSATYANTSATNVEVVVTDMAADLGASGTAATKWGFLCAVSGTNVLANEGIVTISVSGIQIR